MSFLKSARTYTLVLMASLAFSPVVRAQSAFDDPGVRSATGAAGDLKPVSPKVDAGTVGIGSSAQVVVLFRNDDNKELHIGVVNLYPSSNISASVGENQCAAGAIKPGEVCAISVQVKGLQAGQYRIEMLVRHDGRAKLLTTTINGSVESSGNAADLVSDIESIPNSIDFASLTESQAQVRAVILRNRTSKPIKIESVNIESSSQSGFSVDSNCGELATGAACIATVTWAPKSKGPATGTLVVRHDGATGLATIDLKGTYDPDVSDVANLFPDAVPGKGLLISSQEDIDFGSGIQQSSSMAVSLVNVGDMPLTLTGIRMANNENGVRVDKSGCQVGTVLSPMEACPLTMIWDPVREGSILDDVQVSHTGARGVLILPLRGDATKAINRDTKAITLGGAPAQDSVLKNIKPLSINDIKDDAEGEIQSGDSGGAGDSGAASSSLSGKKGAQTRFAKKPAGNDLMIEEDGDMADGASFSPPKFDVRGVLEGYTITSYSPRRAIVSGPGGSRVVFDGEETVIGGVLWKIAMRPSAVEFQNGDQKVLLLFDKSLSSVNLVDGQSTEGTTSSTATSSGSSSRSSSASGSSRSSSSRSSSGSSSRSSSSRSSSSR